MHNYKNTLNLPKTKFSMRANLIIQEPKILHKWQKDNLYKMIRQSKINKPLFILHDGPPYANGNIHIGHAINKILKDIILKSKGLSGFDTPYIPGWDCHGLPIEHKIEQFINYHKDKKISNKKFRLLCCQYAKKQMQLQKKDFIRMGIIADWENSYLTMNYKIQADTIRALGKIIENGYLIKDNKPVYWCTECASSLAEAEIEYHEHLTESIYVRFKATNINNICNIFNINTKKFLPTYAIIWTTTPWTLFSNRAIAIHENHEYQLIEINNIECIIIAKKLAIKIIKKLKIKTWKILSECNSSNLELLLFKHPLKNFNVPIILSKHVTLNTGTGLVHIAPAHGPEDYIIGKKYKLEIFNPIDSNGYFLKNTHLKLDGKFALHSNKIIINLLNKKNTLFHTEIIKHNYPYCWRHKVPIIFRATTQWFIAIEKHNLRTKMLKNIKNVKWIPSYGYNQIKSMIKNRPDWCISRQRLWGTPMTLFIHKKTKQLHPDTLNLIEKIASYVEKYGPESWWNLDPNTIIENDAKNYIKLNDVLDVWFDSGATNFTVIHKNSEFKNYISNLYLEGNDQHRGWFMSSLMISTIINGFAPYKEVLTHGFAIDKDGHKMSKSTGNTISPQKIMNTLGADILRLWVASSNYKNDINISDKILQQSVDNYRRIRNTVRFLLGNLYNFQPDINIISPDNMIEIDKWAIKCTQTTQEEIISYYENYNFHAVTQSLIYFCTISMGSFYLDIIKDRLYTSKKNSLPYLSCQTTLFHIIESLVRWITPILPFTADEIWNEMPGQRSKYIFTQEYYTKIYFSEKNEKFNKIIWNDLINIKNIINKFLEQAKKNKIIRNTLEAEIILYTNQKIANTLNMLENELHFLLLISKIKIYNIKDAPKHASTTELNELKIVLNKAKGNKCARCWHYNTSVGNIKEYPELCNNCIINTIGNGTIRKFI